jgi:3-oxoacyl-[acyl-carrier-protein] synthase-3
MAQPSAYIRSTGMYVPDQVVTNHDLAKMFDTSDEWIVQRSGIRERRYAETGVATSDLAVRAVRHLLEKGEVAEDEIDCLILATLSPDIMFPGTGVLVQDKLGWSERAIPCYDIRQQCSGFIYALQMAQSFIESDLYENVLIIGAELHSNALDFSDRGRGVTVLFGDGAAACVVSRSLNSRSRILFSETHADGSGAFRGVHMKLFDIGQRPLMPYDPHSFEENADFFPTMASSKNLFANAVRRMSEVGLSAVTKVGLTVDDIDWILPHQANMRINALVAENLGVAGDKVLYNIHKFGNTTAATIPLLLAEFTETGLIKRGDLMLLIGFGSGFTWGAAVARY